MNLMYWFVLFSASLSFALVAQSDEPITGHFPPIYAENLNVEMKNNVGTGFVSFLKYTAKPVTITHTSLMATVKRYPDKLVINDQENTVEFGIRLSFFDNFSYVNLNSLSIFSENDRFRFTIPGAQVISTTGNYEIEKFTFRCSNELSGGSRRPPPGQDFKFWVCADDGVMSAASLLAKEGSAIANAFSDDSETPDENLGVGKLKKVHLENLLIQAKNGKFSAEVIFNTLINIRLSMDGELKFDPEKSRFAVKIDKAHAAFLPVKKKVFKIFKSLQIKEITVEEPYIYITVGTRNSKPAPEALAAR